MRCFSTVQFLKQMCEVGEIWTTVEDLALSSGLSILIWPGVQSHQDLTSLAYPRRLRVFPKLLQL